MLESPSPACQRVSSIDFIRTVVVTLIMSAYSAEDNAIAIQEESAVVKLK